MSTSVDDSKLGYQQKRRMCDLEKQRVCEAVFITAAVSKVIHSFETVSCRHKILFSSHPALLLLLWGWRRWIYATEVSKILHLTYSKSQLAPQLPEKLEDTTHSCFNINSMIEDAWDDSWCGGC